MGRWFERGGFFVCGAVFALGLAASAASAPAAAAAERLYAKLEVLAEVIAAVQNHYVDAVGPTELVYGAARGVASMLDAHSEFYAPQDYESLVSLTEGEYAGVGIEFAVQREGPEVVSVFDDSPARRAGILPGDLLVTVDGEPTGGASHEAILQRLRGPVGTKVVVEVMRAGLDAPRAHTLLRSWIRVAPLETEKLGDGVQYVHVKTFARRVASDLESLLNRAKPRGLVLDLRGNPGGLFEEAVALADLFLARGPIVSAVGRDGKIIEHHDAHERGTQPPYPVAILIDRGSASASEIVAGALRDRGRARLFGEQSYGKGSVQSILELSDGSGLKLTVARYLTPSGVIIDGRGIAPDVAVDGTDEAAPIARAQAWVKGELGKH